MIYIEVFFYTRKRLHFLSWQIFLSLRGCLFHKLGGIENGTGQFSSRLQQLFIWEVGRNEKRDGTIFIQSSTKKLVNFQLENQNKKISPWTKFGR